MDFSKLNIEQINFLEEKKDIKSLLEVLVWDSSKTKANRKIQEAAAGALTGMNSDSLKVSGQKGSLHPFMFLISLTSRIPKLVLYYNSGYNE